MTCDFSLEHYDEILHAIEKRAGSVTERKDIILAHDIDISPKYALELARLEYYHGIKATYYVLLHSDWYNALAPQNMALIQEIKALGHEVAFHYDGRYDFDLESVHRAFCSMTKTDSIEVSQHLVGITPNVSIPHSLHDRSAIMKEGYQYIADSGGWWRNGCICQHVDKRMMFLCHPAWWVLGNVDMFSKARADLESSLNRTQSFWEHMINEHRKQKVQVQQRSQ